MGEPERPPRTSGEEQEVAQAVSEKVSEGEEHFQQPEGDPQVHFQLGYVANENREYQEAIEHYTEAIQLDPNNALAYNNRGNAYLSLGQYQRAIQDYDKAIQIDPNYAHAYNMRGGVYYRLGENQRAIQDYDKAIQIDPYYAIAYNNRGYTYEALAQASSWMIRGKWSSKAREDFDKARSLGIG